MPDPVSRRTLLGWLLAGSLSAQDGRPNRRRAPSPAPAAIREGRSFRVLCHYGDGGAASLALSLAEATWKPAALAYGGPTATTGERIRVHLYGDRPAFDRACIALAGRTWPGHAGLTSTAYGISLVLVGEGLSSEVLRGLGPREADLWTIAHECTHLVGQRLSKDYVKHPDWLREGLAESVAQRVITDRAGRAGSPPIAETRAAAAAGAMARAKGNGLRNMLSGAPPGRDVFERYAVQGSFVRFLEREPGRLQGALSGQWSDAQWLELGPAFERHLQNSRPGWGLGPGHFEREGKATWLQVGVSSQRAWAWSLSPRSTAGAWSLDTKLTVDPIGRVGSAWIALSRRSTRERPDRWSETIQAIQLPPGQAPRLVELRYGPQNALKGELTVLAEGDGPSVPAPGESVAIQLRWERDAVRLQLNGSQALRATCNATRHSDWGYGADPGMVLRWQNR